MNRIIKYIPFYKTGLWSINDDPQTWFNNNTHLTMRFNLAESWRKVGHEELKNTFWRNYSREAVQERANEQRRKNEVYRRTLKNKAKKAKNKTRKKKAKAAASKFANEHAALVDFNESLESKSDIQTGKWRQGSDEIYRPLLRQRTPDYDVQIPQIPGPPSTHPPLEPLPPVLPGPPPLVPSGASKRVNPHLERARRLFPAYQAARERNRQLEMLDRVRWNPDSGEFDLTSFERDAAAAVADEANRNIPVKEKIKRACRNAGKEAKKCGMRFMSLMEQLNAGFGGKTRRKKRRRKKKKRTKKKRRKRRKRNTIKKIRLNIQKSNKCIKCYDNVVKKYNKCVKKCQKRKTRKRK